VKIILTGGTGFVGKPLLDRLLQNGHQVVLLTRNAQSVKTVGTGSLVTETWDGKTAGEWARHMADCDAVINLAGEPIAAKRWTSLQKEKIISSRIDAARAIVSAIAKAGRKPSVLINASAIGYYGSVENDAVSEISPKGKGFLADTCERWEEAAKTAASFGIRVVILRLGVVLEKGGGALSKILPPFQIFAGGPLGSGRQWFSWIHREDVVGAILFALDNPALSGPVNVVAPEAVTMGEFCKTLGRVMHRPSWAPVPAFALKILLGEMSEMLLAGQHVVPAQLQKAGYVFHYPKLESALSAILK
jgi:hypothetical protein